MRHDRVETLLALEYVKRRKYPPRALENEGMARAVVVISPLPMWDMVWETTGTLYQHEGRRLVCVSNLTTLPWKQLLLTNIKYESACGCLYWRRPFHLEFSHARNDGADEVDIEDRVEIDQMEDNGNGQKAEAIDDSHGGVLGKVRIMMVMLNSIETVYLTRQCAMTGCWGRTASRSRESSRGRG